MNEKLRAQLIALRDHDFAVRERLLAEGALHRGYHPQMEAVHRANAERLASIITEFGWPGQTLVGDDGAEAAWLIAQHAIGLPDFQRSCLEHLRGAVEAGEAPLWQLVYLEDRIRVFEGRKQRYGTQFDSTADGEPVPYPIEDPDNVEVRRAAARLEPLAIRMRNIERMPPMSPQQYAQKQQDYEEWLYKTGWRKR